MIRYSVCSASDFGEMAGVLSRTFTQGDPPAVAVGLTAAEFEFFVRLFSRKVVAEGLTIVARSVETGEMVGALLTEDSATPPPDGLDRLSASFNPIFDLLGQLDAAYRAGRTVQPGASLHLFLLGVTPHFAGQGIAQGLIAACLAQGAGRRYRVAVTEATSLRSQHVFRKQGFIDRVRRSYEGHRFNGRSFFAGIADQGGPILMDKELSSVRP